MNHETETRGCGTAKICNNESTASGGNICYGGNSYGGGCGCGC